MSESPVIYKEGIYTIPLIKVGEKQYLHNIEVKIGKPPRKGRVDSFPHDRFIVGFMGSAGMEADHAQKGTFKPSFEPTITQKAAMEEAGYLVSDAGMIASNGSLYGIPYYATRGAAMHENGYTTGISAHSSADAAKKDRIDLIKKLRASGSDQDISMPDKHIDMNFYAGIDSGDFIFDLVMRDVFNVNPMDIVVLFNGRSGTLDEAAQAYEQGKVIIPFKESGGAAEMFIQMKKNGYITKETGAVILPTDVKHFPENLAIAKEIVDKKNDLEQRTENLLSPWVKLLEAEMQKRQLN